MSDGNEDLGDMGAINDLTPLTSCWNDLYSAWAALVGKPGQEAYLQLQVARKRTNKNSPKDWQWLADSLADQDKKLFVALVFKDQPVPKKLFTPFLFAAVLHKDPSGNRLFIEPCVRTWGAQAVKERLLQYLRTGTNEEKAGAASAFYWVRGAIDEELSRQIRTALLLEFCKNEDLNVRRRILPRLQLDPTVYPEEIRPFDVEAISIARAASDEYILHRIEVQLGAGGPLKPIPT